MKLIFLGTKGYIDIKTRSHFRHASLLIVNKSKKIMIDCGADWLNKVWQIKPDAILLTHIHPDHAWGLKNGSPCPVWTTKDSWSLMKNFKIENNQKKIITPRKSQTICGIDFEAFTEIHSIKTPSIGYRISTKKNNIYYSGDLIYINDIKEALKDVLIYIGDGATISKPLIRKEKDGKRIFGHTTIQTQLTWCKKNNIKQAIITHCGTQIVANPIKAKAKIKELAKIRGINVKVAYDGMEIDIK